nr:hypothetical protein [Tanacetum cinerariifolium]
LNPLLDLYNLLGFLMNMFWTGELGVSDLSPTDRLGESVYNYPYGIVSTLCPWELGDKIHGDIVPLPLRNFSHDDPTVIASYGDVVIGSMVIKKVYYVKGL